MQHIRFEEFPWKILEFNGFEVIRNPGKQISTKFSYFWIDQQSVSAGERVNIHVILQDSNKIPCQLDEYASLKVNEYTMLKSESFYIGVNITMTGFHPM